MKEINRERFEAWLFSQPGDRSWNFHDTQQCVLCSFIKETTNHLRPIVGGLWLTTSIGGSNVEIDEWVKVILRTRNEFGIVSAGNMQQRYRELFPETEIEIQKTEQKEIA